MKPSDSCLIIDTNAAQHRANLGGGSHEERIQENRLGDAIQQYIVQRWLRLVSRHFKRDSQVLTLAQDFEQKGERSHEGLTGRDYNPARFLCAEGWRYSASMHRFWRAIISLAMTCSLVTFIGGVGRIDHD